MADHCCFICATNEGLFLDAADNKQICEWIERCLHNKIPAVDRASIKVCHKCAFEFNQCSSFLKKYEQYRRSGTNNKKGCVICRQTEKTKPIFDLSDDTNFQQKSFNKIQKVLNNEFETSIEDFKFMCIACLYATDVLLDLQHICKRTSTHLTDITNKEIDYLTFPKTDTAIASRKTTSTESSKVTLQELENKMIRTRSRNNKSNDEESQKKTRERCNVCHGFIDLLTKRGRLIVDVVSGVCATCQHKGRKSERLTKLTKKQNFSGTKDCAVYLKDVLKNNETKEQQVNKIEEDIEDSKTSVVKEKNSKPEKKFEKKEKRSKKRLVETENEDTSNEEVPKKKKQKTAKESKEHQVHEVDEDLEESSKTIAVKEKDSKIEKTSEKKEKRSVKRSVETENEDTSSEDVPKKKKLKAVEDPSNDSDSSSIGLRMRQFRRRNVEPVSKPARLTRRQQVIASSLTDAETNKEEDRLRTKRNLKGIDESGKSSTQKRKRIVSTSSSSDPTEQTESETKNARSTVESDKEDIFRTETYICDECGASYENKLISLSHKLSHYKQLKLQLPRINPESLLKGASDACKVDDQIEEPLDNIRITIDDDEEEVAINENKSVHNDSSVGDDTKDVPRRETIEEDNVDMTLVMKDDDDVETQKDTTFVEDVDTNTNNSLTQDKNKKVDDKRRSNETNENNNDKPDKSLMEAEDVNKTSEEEQSVMNGHIEDVQEQSKVVERDGDTENKSMAENKENESMVEDKENESTVEDKENKSIAEDEGNKSMVEDKENKSMVKDKENKIMIEDKENKSVVENKENKSTIEDKENIENIDQAEEETLRENNEKEGEIEAVQKEREIEQTEKDKHAIGDIENDEKEKENKMVEPEQRNLDKPSTNIDNSIVVEDDSPKESNENDSEIQELDNGVDVQSDQMGTSKKKSLESEKMESAKGNVIDICDSDSQDSVVLQAELNIVEDEDTVIVLEDEKGKRKKSMSDSANAAAEVLQEVLDLASAEFQKRLENMNTNNEDDAVEAETLENISREVNNGVDTLGSEGTKSGSSNLVE